MRKVLLESSSAAEAALSRGAVIYVITDCLCLVQEPQLYLLFWSLLFFLLLRISSCCSSFFSTFSGSEPHYRDTAVIVKRLEDLDFLSAFFRLLEEGNC